MANSERIDWRRAQRGRVTIDSGQLHEGFLRHRNFRWAKIALTISIIAVLAYALIDQTPRASGGTWFGYLLGTVGVGLILWLTLLGLRKRAITPGRWSLKAWTSAHVYLGLSLVVIATLHTGFMFGWNVHTLAYALMMVVIGSGLYGIAVYDRLPAALSSNRGELTQRQMLDNIAAIDRQLHDAALPLGGDEASIVQGSIDGTRLGGGLVERLSGRARHCGNRRALDAFAALLPAATGERADRLHKIVTLFERKEAALGLARRHISIRARLEVWLFVHVPATFALIAALIAHVVSVFFYW